MERYFIQDRQEAFEVHNAHKHVLPAVVSIPHSGVLLPEDMRCSLKPEVVLPNVDWYLPVLYGFLQELDFTVLMNRVSRYGADVNRAQEDCVGASYKTNVCYTHTTQGDAMYQTELTEIVRRERLARYYAPYHAALAQLLAEKKRRFAKVYLLDLHSFGLDFGADVILGDRFGCACEPELTEFLSGVFVQQGFSVGRNEPFAGGYITRRYVLEQGSCSAVQIELWYRAYLARRVFGKEVFPRVEPALFERAQRSLRAIFIALREWMQQQM